ncbi:unnamed protein product, partial [Hapterophycus canaliculatus]
LAAAAGHTSVLRLLLKEGADVDATAPRDVRYSPDEQLQVAEGQRAIHAAIDNIHIDCFRMLLRAGTDVNAPNSRGFTPLMSACRGALIGEENSAHCVEMIRMLLERGADPELRDVDGSTALHIAASMGRAEENIVRLLLDSGLEAIGGRLAVAPAAMETAFRAGRTRILGMLLAVEGVERRELWAGLSVEGSSMLHLAAAYGAVAAVGLLLASGADESAVDSKGRSVSEVVGSRASEVLRERSGARSAEQEAAA